MLSRVKLTLLAFALTGSILSCASGGPTKTIPVKFGKATLKAEVAKSELEREHGLMYRRDLGPDEGMIFIFDQAEEANFWMKNTPLPLSIAFLDEKKVVLNIDEMAPYDEHTFHRSKGKAAFAVEANKNWFEAKGIRAGDKASFELP